MIENQSSTHKVGYETDASEDIQTKHSSFRGVAHSVPRLTPVSESEWEKAHPEGFVDEIIPGQHYLIWNFGVGRAELKPEHRTKLKELAAYWRVFNLRGDGKIRLDGHASTSGSSALNEDLSRGRVAAVTNCLEAEQVSAAVIGEGYHGSRKPVMPNFVAVGMAHNRSVELHLVRPGMIMGERPTPEASPRAKPVEPPPETHTPLKASKSTLSLIEGVAQGTKVTGSVAEILEVGGALSETGTAASLSMVLLPLAAFVGSMASILEAGETGRKWGAVLGESYATVAQALGKEIPGVPTQWFNFGKKEENQARRMECCDCRVSGGIAAA